MKHFRSSSADRFSDWKTGKDIASQRSLYYEEKKKDAIYRVSLKKIYDIDPKKSPPINARSWHTVKVYSLKAGTLETIVSFLFSQPSYNSYSMKALLSTYRTFTTADHLIQLVLQQVPSDVSKNGIQQITAKINQFVDDWISLYRQDFDRPPEFSCLNNLITYFKTHSVNGEILDRLTETLNDFQIPKNSLLFSTTLDKHDDTSSKEYVLQNFLNLSVQLIAEQVTYIDSELFKDVVPYHCLGCVWGQREKNKFYPPTVKATVQQFNNISQHVRCSLQKPHLSIFEQAKYIEKWIDIAQKCKALRNFSSLKSITMSIRSCISETSCVWCEVSRPHKQIFEHLCSLKDSSETQSNVQSGYVPYLGKFLHDLIFIDTAFPDTIDNLINFEKRMKEFEILNKIIDAQRLSSLYEITPVDEIIFSLRHFPVISNCSNDSEVLSIKSSISFNEPADGKPEFFYNGKIDLESLRDCRSLSSTTSNFSNEKNPSDQLIVRVILDDADHTIYKTIIIGRNDRYGKVLKTICDKFCIKGLDAENFRLIQVFKNKEILIPRNSNVYYALNRSGPQIVVKAMDFSKIPALPLLPTEAVGSKKLGLNKLLTKMLKKS